MPHGTGNNRGCLCLPGCPSREKNRKCKKIGAASLDHVLPARTVFLFGVYQVSVVPRPYFYIKLKWFMASACALGPWQQYIFRLCNFYIKIGPLPLHPPPPPPPLPPPPSSSPSSSSSSSSNSNTSYKRF